MGWAEDPSAVRAAREAEAEAQASIARRLDAEADRKLTAFERRQLGVLEDIRDAIADLKAAPPHPGPLLATVVNDTPRDVIDQITFLLRQDFPSSIVVTENTFVDIRPLAAAPPAVTEDGLASLLDASPTALGRAVTAGADALLAATKLPLSATALTVSTREQIAEVVIEAALASIAAPESSPAQGAEVDGAAGGSRPAPPADNPNALGVDP